MLDRALGIFADVDQDAVTPTWKAGDRVTNVNGDAGIITDTNNVVWLDDGSQSWHNADTLTIDIQSGNLQLVS